MSNVTKENIQTLSEWLDVMSKVREHHPDALTHAGKKEMVATTQLLLKIVEEGIRAPAEVPSADAPVWRGPYQPITNWTKKAMDAQEKDEKDESKGYWIRSHTSEIVRKEDMIKVLEPILHDPFNAKEMVECLIQELKGKRVNE